MYLQLPLFKSTWLFAFVSLTVIFVYCLGGRMLSIDARAQSLPLSTPIAEATTDTVTPTLTIAPVQPAPLLLFSTPPPVRTEEPLTSGFRNVPAVFQGVETYNTLQARLTTTHTQTALVTTPLEAIRSVVQILRCDDFGCDTPVGSGVIVHSSGLILTAYHVLLEDPNDLRSTEYQTFVIAFAETPRSAPLPRYLASVVADKNEQDIALLAIDREIDETSIAPEELNLPALPFADVDQLFADTLHVLGYPLDGGGAINYDQATFRAFNDNGRLIVVDRALRRGNSGGPALVLQDGRMAIAGLVIRGRSTQGSLEQEGILRTIDQVAQLNWSNDVGRVMGRRPQVEVDTIDDEVVLQLAIELSMFDLVSTPERLQARPRLLFYGVNTATGEPWQVPDTPGPVAIWANINPEQVIDVQTAQLTVPLVELGITPENLHFYGLVWDRDNRQSLWASDNAIPVGGNTLAVLDTNPPMSPPAIEPPAAISTPTPNPTDTAMPTMTSTENAQPVAALVKTSVAATLAALVTSTPTADMTMTTVRLTESAVETLMAIPTNTPIPTLHPTDTMTPLSTASSVDIGLTQTVPIAGDVTATFFYVPAGEFLMGTSETEIDDAVILCEQYYESCSRDGFIDETEQHVLSVDAFWIMETEVSYAQFAAFVDANGYGQEAWWTTAGWRWRTENNITEPWHWNNPEWHQPDRPVIGISWYEAMAYAAWLADQTNLDIRLPTEAEWEKAARGTEALRFPWGNEWNGAFLNYCDVNCTNEWREEAYDDGYATTAPVGSYPSGASFYGARDMAGNVWEWIVSQYMPYPYNPADGREDPTGDARRVLRSGSWGVRPIHVRAALRHKSNPDGRYVNAGIRLVLSAAPQ